MSSGAIVRRERKPISQREADRLNGVWLTPRTLAALLDMNERTVVRYLEQGKLPGRKIGTKWRTPRAAIDAWIEGLAPVDSLSPPQPLPSLQIGSDGSLSYVHPDRSAAEGG